MPRCEGSESQSVVGDKEERQHRQEGIERVRGDARKRDQRAGDKCRHQCAQKPRFSSRMEATRNGTIGRREESLVVLGGVTQYVSRDQDVG
jgi:hypothetical protein